MEEVQWQLQGKTFIVTGASSGMGAETAKFLGGRGSNVVLQGRDRARLKTIADAVVKAGGKALTVELDLEKPELMGQLVTEAMTEFGEINGLVLNASLFEPRPIEETDLESLDRQWTTNVTSHFMIVKAAVPFMKPGSSIIFVASTTGLAGFPGCSAYGATKGAMASLGRNLAVEFGPLGIRVNTVAPGFVRTPMLTPILDAIPGYEEILIKETPAGRIGRPEEIGATIGFLLSGLAPYINGVTLPVDGGWTAK